MNSPRPAAASSTVWGEPIRPWTWGAISSQTPQTGGLVDVAEAVAVEALVVHLLFGA